MNISRTAKSHRPRSSRSWVARAWVARHSRINTDDGFGLTEVLVAFVLLMVVVLPSSLLIGNILAQSSNNRASVAAGQIAEQALESAHGVLSKAMTSSCNEVMPCSIALADQTVGHITYHTTMQFQWALIGSASADVCTSLTVPQVASAVATVKWGPGLHSLSESTVVNLPYTPTNLNDGFLAVQVDGVTNHTPASPPGLPANFGQPNVVVTVTSDTGSTVTFPVTDSNGCAFAAVPANLSATCPTGETTCTNYTVTLSPPASSSVTWVDQNLNPSPSSTVTVAPTQVTGPAGTFTYDEAATISMSYPSVTGVEGGVTCPLPSLCVASGQSAGSNPSSSLTSATYADRTGANNGIPSGGLAYDSAGPLGTSGVSFDGIAASVQTATQVANPQSFSLSAWFKTTTSGSIIGFTNSQAPSGQSTWDRQIWIDPAGHVVFGVYPGSVQEVSSPGTYTDGRWHNVVASLSSGGMALYLDGSPVATKTTVTSAQVYNGWWHLGWSNAGQGWADGPTTNFFSGSLAQVAIFPSALSGAQVSSLAGAPSAASYATDVTADGPSSYYPLNQTVTNGQATSTPTASLLSYTGSSWATVAAPTGLARLTSLTCPSATQCEGVGNSTSDTGMIISGSLSSGNWTFSSYPVTPGTNLSSITCPSTTECLATGYATSGGTHTGLLLIYDGSTWSTVGTNGVTNLTSVVCPTTTACVMSGTNGAAPMLYTFSPTRPPATTAFHAVTLSPAATSISSVSCPANSGTPPACFVSGTSSSGAAAWSSNNDGSTWASVGSIPTGTTSLGTPVCTSASVCMIPANSTTNDSGTVLSLAGGGSPYAWTASGAPASFPPSQWVASVACSSGTCFAAGQGSPGSSAPTPMLATTSGGGNWSPVSLPGSTTQATLYGLDCGSFGCVAVGESTSADLLYSYASGTWTTGTDPSTAAGLVGLGFSATVANSLLPGGYDNVAPSVAGVNPTLLSTPLYPFVNGYSVFPGSCPPQASVPLTTTAPPPGGSATALAQLDNAAFEVVDATGQPVPGATVTATAATSQSGATCSADTFTLPTTGADGLTAAGFPLGTYTLTINGVAMPTTVTIADGSITDNQSSITYPQPTPLPVVAP